MPAAVSELDLAWVSPCGSFVKVNERTGLGGDAVRRPMSEITSAQLNGLYPVPEVGRLLERPRVEHPLTNRSVPLKEVDVRGFPQEHRGSTWISGRLGPVARVKRAFAADQRPSQVNGADVAPPDNLRPMRGAVRKLPVGAAQWRRNELFQRHGVNGIICGIVSRTSSRRHAYVDSLASSTPGAQRFCRLRYQLCTALPATAGDKQAGFELS